jgi:DNA polymerase phi
MTGQEERDVLFARLFGFTAVIQSSLLVRTTPVASSASSTTQPSTLTDYQEVLSQLISLGQKKSWMKESAWWTIALAIDVLHKSDVSWKEEAIDHTIQRAFSEDSSWSPEKIAIALKLQETRPDKDWGKIMSPSFKTSDLFTTAHLPILARILKVSQVFCVVRCL